MTALRPGPIHLSFLLPPRLAILPSSSIRHAHTNTTRRTTKRLRITKPDKAAGKDNGTTPNPGHDHIVFNPPSSAPSPYHTPAIFLPPGDPRRNIFAEVQSTLNPYVDPARRLPRPVVPVTEKSYHLTAEQIEEIRALRTADPFKWTRKALAEKYNCSDWFVGMCVQAPKQRLDWARAQVEAVKARWGKRRTYAREERQKRRVMWARDE